MTKINFPIIEIENNKFQVGIDLNIYAKEVVTAAIYKFTHIFYVHQMVDKQSSNRVIVVFESKEENIINVNIPKQFCNELIDQQLRFDTEKKFGHIRNMIVEEAFKPITR